MTSEKISNCNVIEIEPAIAIDRTASILEQTTAVNITPKTSQYAFDAKWRSMGSGSIPVIHTNLKTL